MACINPILFKNPRTNEVMKLPCRCCMNCRIAERSKLQLCCTLELHECYKRMSGASFITLTYDDEHIPSNDSPRADVHSYYKELRKACKKFHVTCPPENSTLRKVDFQNFMKRFRRFMDYYYPNYYASHEVKFVCTGEYGGKIGRPHIHIIVFDVQSAMAFKCASHAWTKGIVDCSPLGSGGVRYVLDYIDSKIVGSESKAIWKKANIEPPFMTHSTHFGFDYVLNHLNDIKESEGFILIRGKKVPLPRQLRYRFGFWREPDFYMPDRKNDLAEAKRQGFSNFLDYDRVQTFVKEESLVSRCRDSGKCGVSNDYLTYFTGTSNPFNPFAARKKNCDLACLALS